MHSTCFVRPSALSDPFPGDLLRRDACFHRISTNDNDLILRQMRVFLFRILSIYRFLLRIFYRLTRVRVVTPINEIPALHQRSLNDPSNIGISRLSDDRFQLSIINVRR